MSQPNRPILRAIVRDDEGLPQAVYTTSQGLSFTPTRDMRDKRVRGLRPLGALMGPGGRWSLDRGAESELLRALDEAAPDAAQAFRSAQVAPNAAQFGSALDAFDKALRRWKRGCVSMASAADATIYHYTAPIITLSQVWRKRMTEPTLVNIIPKIATGTARTTWQYYEEAFDAGLPRDSATLNPHEVMGAAAEEREPRLFKLMFQSLACGIDGRTRELHEEMMGLEGAPDWDIYAERVDSISASVWRGIARIMAFGEPTKGIHGLLEFDAAAVSGDNTGAGLLAVGAINFLGGGTTSYDALNAQIRRQRAQVDQEESLIADTLILAPDDFTFLSQDLLDSAAGSGKVLETFWDANPQIRSIEWAHEMAPRAKDEALLLAGGKSAAEAARLSGGIRVSNTQKTCAALIRKDPQELAWIEGVPLSVKSHPEFRGNEVSQVRASTGGTHCFAQGVQSADDPTPGAATGAFRVFWR